MCYNLKCPSKLKDNVPLILWVGILLIITIAVRYFIQGNSKYICRYKQKCIANFRLIHFSQNKFFHGTTYIILWAAVNIATDLTDRNGMSQSDTAHMYWCYTVNRSIKETAYVQHCKHKGLKKSQYHIPHSLYTNYRRTHLVGEENIRSVSVNNHCHHELKSTLFLFLPTDTTAFMWSYKFL
jgi:hypothetical protein